MKTIKYYIWNVIIAYGFWLPIFYIMNIMVHIKYALLDKNHEIRQAINAQNRLNAKYRLNNSIKGLLDPISIFDK